MPTNGQPKKKDPTSSNTTTGKHPVVVNSVTLDPKNPIPLNFGSDAFLMVVGKRYLPFLTASDNLAQTFWNARLLSTTQNACISTIAQTTIGEGLVVSNVEEDKVDPDFLKWIENINNEGQSLNEVCRIILDAKGTDGNAWVELSKGKFGSTPYLKPYVHTTLVCRLGEIDEKTGRPLTVVRSNQLARDRRGMVTSRTLKAVELPLYSANPLDKATVWKKIEGSVIKDELHTVIHLKNDIPGIRFYGMPRSTASLRQQVLEGKYAQYDLDMLENNMVLSALLIFKGSMSQEEALRNARNIVDAYTGQGRMGRVGVISSEGGVDDFEYKAMETQKEGSFIEKKKQIQQDIITSHNWDSVLAGISRESSLGNGSNYIRSAFESRKVMVLKPEADYLVQKFVKPLVQIAADHFGKPEWKNYEFAFQHAMPFSLLSDIDVNAVLTKDEGREILGRQPMEDKAKGAEFIRNTPQQQPPQNNASNVSDKSI